MDDVDLQIWEPMTYSYIFYEAQSCNDDFGGKILGNEGYLKFEHRSKCKNLETEVAKIVVSVVFRSGTSC